MKTKELVKQRKKKLEVAIMPREHSHAVRVNTSLAAKLFVSQYRNQKTWKEDWKVAFNNQEQQWNQAKETN